MGNEAAVKKDPVKEKATAETPEVQTTPVAEVANVTPAVPVELNSTMSPSRIKLGESMFNHWRISFRVGTTKELIEHEPFWVHVCGKLKQADTIDGMTDDAVTYFRCIVIASGEKFAQVKVIEQVALDAASAMAVEVTYYSKHRGQHHKWCALRVDDDTVIKSGFESQKQANLWIESQMMAMKR